jgi:hypothetical protein
MADANRAGRGFLAGGQGSGLSRLRDAVDGLVKSGSAALARSPWIDPLSGLRGPQPLPAVPRAQPRGPARRPNYVADLTDPSIAPALTRSAGRDGFAYIEEYPAANLTVRTSLPELRAQMKDFVAGKPLARSAWGPRVTYINDDAGAPTSRQPVTTPTAGMVAAAIVDAGLESANVNSTTGGHKDNPHSRHLSARAMDIDQINGLDVGQGKSRNRSPDAVAAYAGLQAAYARQPNIYENFGPLTQEKTTQFGFAPTHVASPKVWGMHQNHVHASGQR